MMNTLLSVKRSYCALFAASVALIGCQSIPDKPQSFADPLTPKTVSTALPIKPQAKATKNQYNLPIDTLYGLLVAEVAASRQQYATTIDNYVEQARTTRAPSIIQRAARIAQFLRAHSQALEMGLLWLEQDPINREALATVANAYIELGQPLPAIDYIEQLIAHNVKANEQSSLPVDDGALIETLANRHRQADKATLSLLISRLSSLAERYPNIVGLEVGLSTLHQADDNYTLARQWINKALATDSVRTSTILQDIRLLQASNQPEKAISKLKNYVERSPDNHRLRLIYARLLSQSNIVEAYQQFTILAEQSPDQLDIRFSRALLATELEKTRVAKPLFVSLLDAGYQPDNVRFYLGHLYDLEKQTDTALAYYLAVEQGDHFLSAQYRAASVFLEKGEVESAQALYRALHQQHPDKAEQLYENEASLLTKYKAHPQAMALLNTAIAAFPDNSNLRYDRATIYERQGNTRLMEQDFRHVLTIDPNNVAALNGLGYLLTIHTDRYEEAYQLIEKALSLRPDDAAIIDSMGWVLFHIGRLEEAITYLKRAYEKYPNPEVAAHLGEALWANNEQDAAKAIWRESLEKDPDAEDIPNTLERLGIAW